MRPEHAMISWNRKEPDQGPCASFGTPQVSARGLIVSECRIRGLSPGVIAALVSGVRSGRPGAMHSYMLVAGSGRSERVQSTSWSLGEVMTSPAIRLKHDRHRSEGHRTVRVAEEACLSSRLGIIHSDEGVP